MTNFERVKQFMTAFGQDVPTSVTWPDEITTSLRVSLIGEELGELVDAITDKDIVEVADAITDLLYVVYGTAVAFGMDADTLFKEVHDSNMTKLGPDGKPIRNEYGKVMKGPSYMPPDIAKVLYGVNQNADSN
jgi:predicted HAD superfamily Cof-like phosphohydrolase